MTLFDWANREVSLAKELEKQGLEDGEFDYGGACYDSALKAFRSLTEDGHSGMSIRITKSILNRLIDGQPLTPIEDTDDIWNEIHYDEKEHYKVYQCKRMSSLFKDVYDDGRVEYYDISGFYCIDITTKNTYHSNLVRKIIGEMFPIEMPYNPPNKPIQVFCEDCLTDPNNGDYDTVGILYLINSDGVKVDINRYFKEEKENWIEITITEYIERLNMGQRNEIGESYEN